VLDRRAINELMSAAADGERAAIDPLFAALWPIVVGYTTRWLGDAGLAEDAAQDALVKLFGQLARYERDRDGLTWALCHATWQCRTVRRSRARHHERAALPVDEPTPHERGEQARAEVEDRELVRAALDTLAELPARDREVIAASLFDDGELRGTLAPATFRKRLERAVTRLRTSWRSRHGTL